MNQYDYFRKGLYVFSPKILFPYESILEQFFLQLVIINLNLKFHQMDFLFEFLDVHMNEKIITYHDFHGFKWKNINIYLCNSMSFLAL
jgi:hypothetical protein